jgi:TolB-like protein
MCTGKLPFRGDTSAMIFNAILEHAPVPPSRINPDVPLQLQEAIHKTLEKDCGVRCQSAAELRADLKRMKRMIESARAHAYGAASSSSLVENKSISVAVLPFENVGAQPDLEYLSDGITEVIISSLSRKQGLKVMARSTVFHYKGRIGDAVSIGKELGVSSVVTGRVLQRGNMIRVGVELVDVGDGWQLWGEQCRRSVDAAWWQKRDDVDPSQAPLRTGVTTRWPWLCRKGANRSHVPVDCHAPCTRTNVDIGKRLADADVSSTANPIRQSVYRTTGLAVQQNFLFTGSKFTPGSPQTAYLTQTPASERMARRLLIPLLSTHSYALMLKNALNYVRKRT